MSRLFIIVLPLLLAACATAKDERAARSEFGTPDSSYRQSPNPTIKPTTVETVALAGATAYAVQQYAGSAAAISNAIGVAIAAYVVFDPLAANWTIEETMVDSTTFLLSMRAKSFRTGGDGESGLILRRRAAQLQRERGYCAYRIGAYSEGIESSTPFSHRYAEGVIHLVNTQACDGAKPSG